MRRTLLGAAVAVPLLLTGSTAAAAPRPGPGHDDLREVTARVETPALFDDEAGGDADGDDPAIWVHPWDRRHSLVIATAKNGGLRVYDLRGREVQSIATPAAPGPDDEPGRFNNVDLVPGFRLGGRQVDLAVVSDRGRDQIRSYRIDAADAAAGRPPLHDVTAAGAPFAFSRDQAEVNIQATAYGLAAYGTYLVVSQRSRPTIGLFRLVATAGGVSYRRVDKLDFPATFRLPDGTTWSPCQDPGDGPQFEGMTVDPVTGTVYAAQEDIGLWRVAVRPDHFHGVPRVVEHTREYGVPATFDPVEEECVVDYGADPGFGGRIAADVEGVAIYRDTLLVSSQGDNTFFTYDRWSNRPTGRFAVADGPAADGSQDCDGAAVVATALPGYQGGLLVVHDGENTPDVPGGDGEPRPNTNFKFVDAGFLGRLPRVG
jgi:3-phytase